MIDELKQWEYDRGYEKGRADREKEICDFLKEIANSDDVNAKMLLLIEQLKEVEHEPRKEEA